MYQCEACRGTFATFQTPGRCPLCNVWADVRCQSCKYIDTAKAFFDNGDRCPKCNAQLSSTYADAWAGDVVGWSFFGLFALFGLFLCWLGGLAMTEAWMNWDESGFLFRMAQFGLGVVLLLVGPGLVVLASFASTVGVSKWWVKGLVVLYLLGCAGLAVGGGRSSYQSALRDVLWSIQYQREQSNYPYGPGKYSFWGGIEKLEIFVQHVPDAEELNLSDAKITNSELRLLQSLPKLRVLKLHYVPITDAGLVHLHELPALEELSVIGTRITPDGVKELERIRPTLKIITKH